MSLSARITAALIVGFAHVVTAVRGVWDGIAPIPGQRIYFANHNSHGDFVLVWTVLPRALRFRARPVAGADYWLTSKLKSFIGKDVFNAVLIDRNSNTRTSDPVTQMSAALKEGDSLILFPEGTRNTGQARLLPFKSGLFHLATANPEIDIVPVWIENLNRVMPKGALVPIPLICTVTFGAPMRLAMGEGKADFLARAESALNALAPERKI
ncbi:lysophospholipid acyltransferase family protein [Primorskyibacter flagellatus]|uniref:1-acyl-sn-glycerol-3-phosphate acyltransferases n=1 Tax=Primorskyibacter flagellatus TaxID=1387277 RepID=A0A1W2C405_9RHOB|nr:lysophospholipid acyltransferase family protein [Primorskyibacter flagellatus]SMC79880.1 1-acyl-sn-glycerol-3-phosphate acyltransferases [Primorskyibacter flagellatus]